MTPARTRAEQRKAGRRRGRSFVEHAGGAPGRRGRRAGERVCSRPAAAQTARGLAEQIIANAKREADTIRRQADLAAKEEVLRRREELDAEVEAARRDLREQERRIEKRSDLLDQKLELINRKEHDLADSQAALADLQEGQRRQELELKQALADQLETLAADLAALARRGPRAPAEARRG